MPEAAEVEVSPMLEEIATSDAVSEVVMLHADIVVIAATMSEIHVVIAATMSEIHVVIAAGFVVEIVSLRAIKPAVLAVLIPRPLIVERAALRSLAVTAELTARAVISHTRSARPMLGTKAWARSTAAVAEASATPTTASMCSKASNTTAAVATTTAAASASAVVALRVSAAREDER
jgi:hypothetical protein